MLRDPPRSAVRDLAAVQDGGKRQPLGWRSDGNSEALYASQRHPRNDRCAQPQPNRQPKGGADDGRAASRLLTGWGLDISVSHGLGPYIRRDKDEWPNCGQTKRQPHKPLDCQTAGWRPTDVRRSLSAPRPQKLGSKHHRHPIASPGGWSGDRAAASGLDSARHVSFFTSVMPDVKDVRSIAPARSQAAGPAPSPPPRPGDGARGCRSHLSAINPHQTVAANPAGYAIPPCTNLSASRA
ncbi:hypothetical protein FIU85_04595 [Roseovarius sp. THAF8]|nr:hypothetical protein FIU85_04595 [Roseovarius sp. THAF8]